MKLSKNNFIVDLSRLQLLPKADLHCHLDGSLRKSTLIELAEQQNITLPSLEFIGQGFASLEDYLAVFPASCSVLQTAEALTRVAYELVEDAVDDGIWHLEVRFSPLLFIEQGLSYPQQIQAVHEGISRAQKKWPISVDIILCGLRHRDAALNLEVAKAAVQARDLGVVAFDLAGPEKGFAAHLHGDSFREAQKHCLNITIHAAEADGPASVRDALFNCGAHRIGHGTELYKDPELLQYVIDHRIPIEVCLSSSKDTGAVKQVANHPIKQYWQAGALVTLNTDNRLISNTSLSKQYLLAHEHLGLNYNELVQIARNGFLAAFLPWGKKQQLLAKFDVAVDLI